MFLNPRTLVDEEAQRVKAEAVRADKAEARVVELETEIHSLREDDAAQRATVQETVDASRAETGRAREEVAELRGRLAVLTEQATRYWDAALPQAPAVPSTTSSGDALPETPEDPTPAS
ncbi:hypothetical protein [Paeniglutamicibacter antarcticus]|uniref:Cellulase n=1 Tax=Paeniglutamicibacter antarcticus TaxID=494023 RepID=A0ABP9TMB2_9MICC